MSERPNERQGPRNYEVFDEYMEEWVKPYLLDDLDTVFTGARKHAGSRQRRGKGRGDFVLATALFTLFDHFGAFLAKHHDDVGKRGSLKSDDNIARVAKLLKSTQDVYAIVVNLGRNALVHGAWPQTAMEMQDGWAFGYTIGADAESEHDLLYVAKHSLSPTKKAEKLVPVLKLAHNVHVLYREFVDELRTGTDFQKVNPHTFRRVQNYSLMVGLPQKMKIARGGQRKRVRDWMDEFIEGGDTVLERGATRDQAGHLERETRDTGIWDDPELTYYRRTKQTRRVSAAKT